MAELTRGGTVATATALAESRERVGPIASRLGCERELEEASRMASENGAIRQRSIAAERGPEGLVGWLAESYLEDMDHRISVP